VHFHNKLFALHLGGCLFQQYIVNVVTKTQHNIHYFLVLKQAQLRAKLYQRLVDMVEHDVLHKWVSELFSQLHFVVFHIS
jgi:hypothetical protein